MGRRHWKAPEVVFLRRGGKGVGQPVHLATAGPPVRAHFCSSPRAWPSLSASINMDFREILMIASKGQGVNNVPVSSCWGISIGDPNLQVQNVYRVELPRIRLSARREERPEHLYFLFVGMYFWELGSKREA